MRGSTRAGGSRRTQCCCQPFEPILSPKTCSTYGPLYLVLSYGFLPNRGAHRCYRSSGSKSARKVGSSIASDGWLPHAQTPAFEPQTYDVGMPCDAFSTFAGYEEVIHIPKPSGRAWDRILLFGLHWLRRPDPPHPWAQRRTQKKKKEK